MTIETSKNTGYVVHSSSPDDSAAVVKVTGYAVLSTVPDDGLAVLKETCYVVLKPLSPNKPQIVIINM